MGLDVTIAPRIYLIDKSGRYIAEIRPTDHRRWGIPQINEMVERWNLQEVTSSDKPSTPIPVSYSPDSRKPVVGDSAISSLKQIVKIIEDVDRRAMATDGPVLNTIDEMTNEEIRRIYRLAQDR